MKAADANAANREFERAVTQATAKYKVWTAYLGARLQQLSTVPSIRRPGPARKEAIAALLALAARAFDACPFPSLFVQVAEGLHTERELRSCFLVLALGFRRLPSTQHRLLWACVLRIAEKPTTPSNLAADISSCWLAVKGRSGLSEHLSLLDRRGAHAAVIDALNPVSTTVLLKHAELLQRATSSVGAELSSSSAETAVTLTERVIGTGKLPPEALVGLATSAAAARARVSGPVAGRSVLERAMMQSNQFNVFHALFCSLVAFDSGIAGRIAEAPLVVRDRAAAEAFPASALFPFQVNNVSDMIDRVHTTAEGEEALWAAVIFRRRPSPAAGLRWCDGAVRGGFPEAYIHQAFRGVIDESLRSAAVVKGPVRAAHAFFAYALYLTTTASQPDKGVALLLHGAKVVARGADRRWLFDAAAEVLLTQGAPPSRIEEVARQGTPQMLAETRRIAGDWDGVFDTLWKGRRAAHSNDVCRWAGAMLSSGRAADARRLLCFAGFARRDPMALKRLIAVFAVKGTVDSVELVRFAYATLSDIDAEELRNAAEFEERVGSIGAAAETYIRWGVAGAAVPGRFAAVVDALSRLRGADGLELVAERFPDLAGDAIGANGRYLCDAFAKAGNVDLARTLFRQLAEAMDPLADPAGVWAAWKEFEVRHGTLSTFEDMERFRRAVAKHFAGQQTSFEASSARIMLPRRMVRQG